MVAFQILDNPKKKRFIEKLGNLGVEKIPYLLLKPGQEKVMAYSGSLTNTELYTLWETINVESIGLYFGKEFPDEARLSLDALHILKEQIKGNIVELDEEQAKEWFFGKPAILTEQQKEEYKEMKSFVAVKFHEDFIGTGKISENREFISSFLPKERRVRSQ